MKGKAMKRHTLTVLALAGAVAITPRAVRTPGAGPEPSNRLGHARGKTIML